MAAVTYARAGPATLLARRDTTLVRAAPRRPRSSLAGRRPRGVVTVRAEGIFDKIKGAVDSVSKSLKGGIDSIGKQADKAGDAVKDTKNEAQENADKAASNVKDAAKEGADNVSSGVDSARKEVKDNI